MNNNKVHCPYCNTLVSTNNIKRHIGSKTCLKVQKGINIKRTIIKRDESWKQANGKYQCPECNKQYAKKGITSHMWRMHGDGRNFTACHDGYKAGTRTSWNKGLTKETNSSVMASSKTLKEKYASGELIGSFTGKHHTQETKDIFSKNAINNKLGGVRQSKIIEYQGKKLGSSYEYILAQDLDKHNIKWDTCNRIKYCSPDGKERTYTPDLYLPEYDIYLDPKNDFLINNVNPRLGFKDVDKIKWVSEQNNIIVFVLNKSQLNWNYILTLIEK